MSAVGGCTERWEIVSYLVMLSLLVASSGGTGGCAGIVPDMGYNSDFHPVCHKNVLKRAIPDYF